MNKKLCTICGHPITVEAHQKLCKACTHKYACYGCGIIMAPEHGFLRWPVKKLKGRQLCGECSQTLDKYGFLRLKDTVVMVADGNLINTQEPSDKRKLDDKLVRIAADLQSRRMTVNQIAQAMGKSARSVDRYLQMARQAKEV